MDLPVHRCMGGAKYGKSRKVLGYNFFDAEMKAAPVAAATTRLPISPASPGNVLLDINELIVPSKSPCRSAPNRPAHITSHSISSVSYSNEPRSNSPSKQSSETSGRADVSMFDLISSDDEQYGRVQPPAKRRKLTQPLKQHSAPTKPQTQTAPGLEKIKKQKNATTQPSKVETRPKPRAAVPKKQEPKSVTSKKSESQLQDESKTTKVISNTRLKKGTYGKKNVTASRRLQPATSEDISLVDAVSGTSTARAMTTDEEHATTQLNTPRKQRPYQIDSDTSAASLGQLGLAGLRLTPEKRPRSRVLSVSVSPVSKRSPPRRGRTRRIDLLDAPEEDTTEPSTRAASADSSSQPPYSKLEVARETRPTQTRRPELSRTSSSQTRQTYGRARNTYGRERSHLADMVDDLDALSNDSSQEASQQLLSQLASQSGPSQLQMELDLEDSSSDDPVLGVKLKSIHELRQAGTNNRFERDLETLLDDIDPLQDTASKSLRLQSLMKLFRKMKDDDFTSFISDRALDRLATWSRSVKDKLSKLLFDMVLWRMVHSKNSSPTKLRKIAQAVASSTALITNLHTMAQIARDRRENLSKILLRELIEFEEDVLNYHLLPVYHEKNIVPAAVTTGSLHDSLRQLAEAGATNISVGTEACKSIIDMLEKASRATGDGVMQYKVLTTHALSLLKLFAGPLDSDLGLSDSEYLLLGNTLASIIDHTLNKDEELVQSVYHFAISLCNDRPQICRQIVLSKLPVAAIHIIDSRFLDLVDVAQSGNAIDQVMLDSIILSLACLLNITEHDDDLRQQFASKGSHLGPSALQKLVAIYTQAAPKLEEATTTEQSQMLVSFGYLSLLICNLCLDQELWVMTSKILDNFSISDVVASAKELLIYMQTLDMAQLDVDMSGIVEDGNIPVDGITQRFRGILAAVRVE